MQKLKTKAITLMLLMAMVLAIFAAIPMASAAVAVTLSPISGTVGTKVTVSGTGASIGGLVEVYWENLGGPKLNSAYALGDGTYSCVVTIPDAVAGNHFIIVRDVSTGSTVGAAFTIGPKITLSSISGIPGDSVTVTGSGFAATKNMTITFRNDTTIIGGTYVKDVTPALMNSTATGNFSTTITVPAVDYGPYVINATDASANTAGTTFKVGAAITLTPTSGVTGTVVTIAGRGFTKTAGINVTITVGGITAKQVAAINTLADGTFTGQFIVPTLAIGTYTNGVVATDGTYTATATFKVTGTTGIVLTPTSGQPGWEVTIEGTNFTAIANIAVTVKFAALTVATLYTNATGGFKGTFNVPSLPTGPYTVNATDANGLTATASYTVAITLLTISPVKGPTGTVVSVTGYGFTTGGTANVTLDTKLVLMNIAVATLQASTTFIVPTLPVGTYTVAAKDSAGLTASTSFEVTKTTELILTPSSAPTGYTVAIAANYFTATDGTAITFILKNSTWSTSPTVTPTSPWTAVQTNATGSFKGTFTVPTIALGIYTLNATDANGLTVEVPFSSVPITVQVSTRASGYLQGDIVSFDIRCTFAFNMIIYIADPTGYPAILYISTFDWVPMGNLQVVPYNYGFAGLPSSASLTLPSDAALGTWTWNTTAGGVTKTGVFTVAVKPTLAMIQTTLAAINATIISINGTVATILTNTGIITTSLSSINATVISISGTVATIKTDVGIIKANVTTIMPIITSINSGFATIQTSVGTIQTSLSSIGATLTSISGGVATISTTVGTIQTSVSAINPVVTSIQSGVATVQTDVGTIKGTVVSTDGKVATIQTDIGTLQADVSGVKTDVGNVPGQILTPIWIAVVLTLIAAIASIVCLIQMRRKIAG